MWADGIATWQGGQGKGLRPEEVAGWIPKIANLPIFPTTNKKWCSLAEGIYVCDDDELAKPFMAKAEQQAPAVQPKQKAEEESDNARARAAREAALARAAAASKAINFLYVPPPDSRSQRGGRMHHHLDNSIEPFLTALGIPRLSASVVVRIVTHQTFYGRPITNLVADIFPYIQRWIFHKRGRQEYMELEEHLNGSNRQRKLGEFSCEVMEKVRASSSPLVHTCTCSRTPSPFHGLLAR